MAQSIWDNNKPEDTLDTTQSEPGVIQRGINAVGNLFEENPEEPEEPDIYTQLEIDAGGFGGDPDADLKRMIIESYDHYTTKKGMLPSEARTLIVKENASGPEALPQVGEWLRQHSKVPTYNSAEEANDDLGSEVDFYLTPVGSQEDGTFMQTDRRAPSAFEGFQKMITSLDDQNKSPEVMAILEEGNRRGIAGGEALAVAPVTMLKGLTTLPLYVDLYSPDWTEWLRMIGDAATWPFREKEERPPWEGTQTYSDRVNSETNPQQLALNAIDKFYDPIIHEIENSIGGPGAQWKDYWDTRVIKLAAEVFSGGGVTVRGAGAVISGVKSLASPVKTVQNIVSLTNTMAISRSIGKATAQTLRSSSAPVSRATSPIPKSYEDWWSSEVKTVFGKPTVTPARIGVISKNAAEFDSAVGAAIAYEGTKSTLGDSPYAEVVAFPMLFLGAVLTPGTLAQRMKAAKQNGLFSRTYYDIGSVFMRGEKNKEKLNGQFLRMRGVSKVAVEKMRQNGELSNEIFKQRLGPRSHKDLRLIRESLQKLQKNDPAVYKDLRDRFEMNLNVYLNLQEAAQKALGPNSEELVSVYLNNVLNISYFDTLLAQSNAVNEGFKVGFKIRLKIEAREMQKSMERIQTANVRIIQNIRENKGAIGSDKLNAFVEFATLADRALTGKIQDSSSNLLERIGKRASDIDSASTKSYLAVEEVLSPVAKRDTPINTANQQREVIDKAFFDDKAVIDNLYGDIDFEIDVDATEFRNFLLAKMSGGSDSLEAGAPQAVRQAGALNNLNVPEDEALNAVRKFAGVEFNRQPLHLIANELTEKGLQNFDEATLQNLLKMSDDHIGNVRYTDDAEYALLSKDDVIKEFLAIKDKTVQTIIPANMTLGKIKTLMSKIGSEYSKNIGNEKGHALKEYWIRAEAMLDHANIPENMVREVLAYKAARSRFKEDFVPRWFKSVDQKIMKPHTRGERAIASESIFKTFFQDSDRIVERGDAFLGILYKLDGTKRENSDQILSLMKHGLRQNMEGMTPQQLEKIIGTYGSSGHKLFDTTTENALKEWLDKSTKLWNIDKSALAAESKRLSNLVNKLETTRLSFVKGSGINELSGSTDPTSFFTKETYVLKTADMTEADKARFLDLDTSVEKGKFGEDVVSARKELDTLKGQTVEKGEIAMTPYEFLRRETNDFKTTVGQEMLETIRNVYATDIILKSVTPNGKRLIGLGEDVNGKSIPIMQDIIDYGKLKESLDRTKEIRDKIFSPESNEALNQALFNTQILAESTERSASIMGMATPLKSSSLMARAFSVARGVLSLRYVAGELTIQGMRLQYVHMMNDLLSDPTAVLTLSKMIDDIPNYVKMDYGQGIRTMAKFLGINSTELSGITEETWNTLTADGVPTQEIMDVYADKGDRKDELTAVERKLKSNKVINVDLASEERQPPLEIEIRPKRSGRTGR